MIYFGHTFSIKIWALFYLILKILSNEEKFVALIKCGKPTGNGKKEVLH